MREYLVSITNSRGAVCSIAYYADTPGKNYRIYYCGEDFGLRYERIGNAEKYLERLAGNWARLGLNVKKRYATRNEIPQRGSNARREVI